MKDTTPPGPSASPGFDANASTPVQAQSASIDAAYRLARRRVRMLRGWYVHALVYACVISGLWAVYAFSGHTPRFPWPLPPTLGWGLGLTIHGLVVWLGTSLKGRQWESRKIEEYMNAELTARRDARP